VDFEMLSRAGRRLCLLFVSRVGVVYGFLGIVTFSGWN
jgi:hypothetical protein